MCNIINFIRYLNLAHAVRVGKKRKSPAGWGGALTLAAGGAVDFEAKADQKTEREYYEIPGGKH